MGIINRIRFNSNFGSAPVSVWPDTDKQMIMVIRWIRNYFVEWQWNLGSHSFYRRLRKYKRIISIAMCSRVLESLCYWANSLRRDLIRFFSYFIRHIFDKLWIFAIYLHVYSHHLFSTNINRCVDLTWYKLDPSQEVDVGVWMQRHHMITTMIKWIVVEFG